VVALEVAGTKLISVIESGPLAALSIGDRVNIAFDSNAAHLFDATTEERR
jgi:hypothetical protein